MFRLNCAVQTYAWGRRGDDSEVARLAKGCSPDGFRICPHTTYAELWMGTHPKAPSTIRPSEQKLSQWLTLNNSADKNPSKTKSDPDDQGRLPFLFKVLSVNQALSVQVHPNVEQAIELHRKDPGNYPDANHKPEMAIALTDFEMLCGFRPYSEIIGFVEQLPELASLIKEETIKCAKQLLSTSEDLKKKTALQSVFSEVMRRDATDVVTAIDTLTKRFKTQDSALLNPSVAKLKEVFLRLASTYPGDIGCFAPFFLNHYILKPGEASFLGPNEPHAYLFGDCVECMACSDNTIRAGLTPKYKDVDTLCKNLTYRMASEQENRFTPVQHKSDAAVLVYDPPVPEFTVHKISVTGPTSYRMLPLGCHSILIVIDGQAEGEQNEIYSKGAVCIIPQDIEVTVTIPSHLLAFRAFCDKSS